MVSKKKKKGSSLLVTVAMFAILSILIMSVLAMTTSGYSMRIKSNKRIENFYAADSGLEISQKVLHDYLGKVVEFSLHEASHKDKHSDKEKVFDSKFKEFIIKGGKKTNSDGSDLAPAENIDNVETTVEKTSNYTAFERDGKAIKIDSTLKAYKEDGSDFDLADTKYEEINKFILNVKSNFIDKENKEREVEVDFEIIIPEYGEVLVRAKNSSAPNILNYIIGVDGDYTITTDTGTNVLGDMWVKGNSPTGDNITPENKYDGGITLRAIGNNVPSITWNGKIATNSTLKIEGVSLDTEAPQGKERDVFARNVVIDDSLGKLSTTKLFNNKTNLYLYNDFLINSEKNNIVLNNLYGLNDINDYESNWENKNLKNAQKSSAMIINSSDFGKGSEINIKNDLYMLGTSYLDLNGNSDYQTGQSMILNNISRPYTIRYDDYLYEYKSYEDGGIQLATKDKDGKELTLNDGEINKVNLVEEFYKTNTSHFNDGLKVGENNIISPGVILANNKAEKRIPDPEKLSKIPELQNRFVQEVFYMGSEENYGQKSFWNNKVQNSVSDSFNWEEINDIAKENYNNDGNTKLIDIDGNNKDFIHIATKNTISEILTAAKSDGHEFGKYDSAAIPMGDKSANLILNNSDKKLILRSTGITATDKANTVTKVVENDNEIIYDVNLGKDLNTSPLLVISKSDVVFEMVNYNYVMFISAGNVEMKGSAANIGNYQAMPQGDRMINELFKYVLESDKIIGDIGGGIFHGTEEKVATNAIEVSKLIKTKNWKLNK